MDLTQDKFQQVLYEMFHTGKVPQHTPLSSNENRCSASGKIEQMTFGQATVYVLSKLLAEKENKNRGFLVWHSTGSGKMCAAAAATHAFAGSDRTVYYITTAALNTASQGKFMTCMRSLFKEDPQRFEFSTYAIIAHRMQKGEFRQNSVIIFDEVHNLFNPLPTQRKEHEYVLDALMSDKYPNIKVIIMTATPGNNREELLTLLNIVRDRRKPKITFGGNSKEFTKSIVGLVSYLDNSKDYSMFPKFNKDDQIEAPMHPTHFAKYLEKLEETPDEDTKYSESSERRYWIAARKYSNAQYDYTQQTEEFSSKINALVQNIAKYPNDKHFVYSAFYENRGTGGGHGVNSIATVLRRQYGYELYKASAATTDLSEKNIPSTKKRFVILTAKEFEKENKEDVLKMVNHPENNHGQFVHVVLASQGFNEGIDLLAVRHVHLLEPLVSFQAEKQAIGRVARHCSHAQLKREFGEWTVTVHRYFSTLPTSSTHSFVEVDNIADEDTKDDAFDANMAESLMIDKKIYSEARERIKEMTQLESCLKSAAMDCILTSMFHGSEVDCIHEYEIQR